MRSTATLDPNSSPLAFCAELDRICAAPITSAETERLDVLEAKARTVGLAGAERQEYMLLLRCKRTY